MCLKTDKIKAHQVDAWCAFNTGDLNKFRKF